MKSTGIVRKLDQLGRITLPIETRRAMGMKDREPLEMYVEGGMICLKKYIPDKACTKCGSTDDVITVEDSSLCHKCLDKFNQAAR